MHSQDAQSYKEFLIAVSEERQISKIMDYFLVVFRMFSVQWDSYDFTIYNAAFHPRQMDRFAGFRTWLCMRQLLSCLSETRYWCLDSPTYDIQKALMTCVHHLGRRMFLGTNDLLGGTYGIGQSDLEPGDKLCVL